MSGPSKIVTPPRLSVDLTTVLIVFSVSAAAMMAAAYLWTARLGVIQETAWSCAALSLLWSVVAAGVDHAGARPTRGEGVERLGFSHFARLASLLFGVVGVIVQAVVLVMRILYVGVDLLHGYPWGGERAYGFGVAGFWTFVWLFLAGWTAWWSVRDRRLLTCQMWLAVLMVLWGVLLVSPFRQHDTGAFERSALTVWAMVGMTGVLAAVAGLLKVGELQQGRNSMALSQRNDPAASDLPPGLGVSCGVLGLAILLLGCYHYLVPVRIAGDGGRIAWLIAAACCAAATWAVHSLLRRAWNPNLADLGMGLTSLVFCGVALAPVPLGGLSLSDAYPMVFNGLIVGLAGAMGLWTYLASAWSAGRCGWVGEETAARLVPHAKRFAFLCAAAALVAGALMTYWPKLPAISAMDHSFGRITAGFAAYLFLLLVMLWSSRRLRRMTLHLLAVLAVMSTAGFIVVRMLPFASRLG